MIDKFHKVLTSIKEAVPEMSLVHSLWYVVQPCPKCCIKVSKPDPFCNYSDIIARVTLFYDNKVIMDNLIGYDTNLNRFCEKLSSRVNECVALWRNSL